MLLWPKTILSWKISIWVSEFYADFKFVDADLNKCLWKKLEPKNYANFEYFRFCAFFRGFLLLTFVRGISESRHQRIWNQHKILRFFDTHIDIFQEKKILGHNSTLCNLKMQMRKKLYIFKHFAKSKNLFFCQYLSFSVWFLLKFQKKYKIEAPYGEGG